MNYVISLKHAVTRQKDPESGSNVSSGNTAFVSGCCQTCVRMMGNRFLLTVKKYCSHSV